MTRLVVDTEYVEQIGAWVDFGYVTCDLCGARVPPDDRLLEVSEISEVMRHDGWSGLGASTNKHACPDCHRLPAEDAVAP